MLRNIQTSDGWMFLGTEEGLVRFDGSSFFLMNKSTFPDLTVNFISTLLGGQDTSLWIGTEGGGLFRYKNNSVMVYNKAKGLSNDRIFVVQEDSTGGIWIGTSGGGLNYLKNGIISKFDTINGLACNYIRSIALDGKGRVWVGTQKGLSVIENGNIRNYFTKDGLSDEFIESLAFDKDQNLWIGTKSGGLNVFKENRFFVYTVKDGLTDNAITNLCFDRKGTLWIGTNGGGITWMNEGRFYPFTTKDGLSSDLIVTIFEDREGTIWAGSSGSGVDRIKKKSIQTLDSQDGLPGDVILPIFEDHSGVLWFGIAGKGLSKLENNKVQTFTYKDGLPAQIILTIGEDHHNSLWIGTAGGGLSCYKDKKFITYTTENGLSNNVITVLYFDQSGMLWVGTTGGGINSFNNGEFSSYTTKNGLSNDNVTTILEDTKGNLWVGTNGGLNEIRGNEITVITQRTGLSNNYILSLYEDSAGNLWIGTADGLNLMRGSKIVQFNTKDGLVNEVVLQILEDDYGYFWISCNKGIYKIKREDLLDFADSKLRSLAPVSYGKSDGMENIECNGGVYPAGCKTRDGKLLFPTMKGISIIDQDMMSVVSSYFSPVFIEEFLVDGHPVSISSSVSVPSYSKRLEFRYAALNYTNPGRIRYRCMLVGFDKNWVECGTSRIAYYTNISAGDYIFKVTASNESGQWNDQDYAALEFHLKPPFYRSLLFYLIVTFFFFLLLFFIIYYFLIRFQRNRLKLLVAERTDELHQKMIAQKQTQQELEKTNSDLVIAKEQAESSNRLKTAFMNNISHEIRTPLNGIIGFSQLMVDKELTQTEREQYFYIVKSSSDRLLNTMTDYMDISLIVSGNQKVHKKKFVLLELLDEIHNKFLTSVQFKRLELIFQSPPYIKEFHINSDRELVSKVLYHLIDNAIKFTNQGRVTYGFEVRGTELEFYVKDTGVGIDREAQTFIFDTFVQENTSNTRGHEGSGLGLSIVRGILELLGGHIWLESVKGQGSAFFFTVPIGKVSNEQSVNLEVLPKKTGRSFILIVDDETSSSHLVEQILKKQAIDFLSVTDGQQAIEFCRQNPKIFLVLMDLRMPFLDGFEATKKIKSFNPHLPIIAMTAYALSGDEKRAIDAGCDDYITKPLDKDVLLKKLIKFGIEIILT